LIMESQRLVNQVVKTDCVSNDLISDHMKNLYLIQGNSLSDDSETGRQIKDDFSESRSFDENIDWMRQRRKNNLPTFEGVPSGYPILDYTLGYFKKSCLYYIGARTSMGKTTFMLNLVANHMRDGLSVGMFSLEMARDKIFGKLVCVYTGVSYRRFEDGDINDLQSENLKISAEYFASKELHIHAPDSISMDQLMVAAQRMVDHHKVKIIYIDYLTRIKPSGKFSSKHLEVDYISKSLQTLARRLEIPIVCLAQLNRDTESNKGAVPTLSCFRESGSIEEDCDAAILLHRPSYYDPSLKGSDGTADKRVQVIVAKNRIRGTVKPIRFLCDSDLSERYIEDTLFD